MPLASGRAAGGVPGQQLVAGSAGSLRSPGTVRFGHPIHLSLSIPTDVPALLLPDEALPPDWASEPPSPGTQALGTDWLRSGASALLKIPSALSSAQSEYNWVLNPMHPDAARLIASQPTLFHFDRRLWKV